MTPEEFGEIIKKMRIEKGMTQSELAERSGILKNNIPRIESGKVSVTLRIANKIAEALNLTLKLESK